MYNPKSSQNLKPYKKNLNLKFDYVDYLFVK